MKKIVISTLIVGSLFVAGCVSQAPHTSEQISNASNFDIHQFVKENYSRCDEPVFCNNLTMVNCGAEVDGPLYYLDKKTGAEISTCGGTCFRPQGEQIEVCNTLCPPPEWTC